MKKKTLLTLLVAPMLIGAATGCEAKADFTIGISQLVRHAALDAATNGFVSAVKEGMKEAGKTVKFLKKNASGDSSNCVVIANTFVSKNVDLIMANATPALQAAANSTLEIPILGTSITDYASALKIDSSEVTKRNISGTSDLAPLDEQAEMILDKNIFPSISKVGLLYCSAETNSLFQVERVEKLLQDGGLATTRLSFSDSNDISSVLNKAKGSVDLIYIPTDNTAASCADTIAGFVRPNKIPVVAGEEGLCAKCGVLTLSINYNTLGQVTGQMALEVLLNNADISNMKIRYDSNPQKKYNETICQELGITPPEGYTKIA